MGQLPHPSIWGAPPLVWMISQYLSYICTLEGDAYGTNFPLLYFVINIFMMKIDAYGEFVSSVATHGHYASYTIKHKVRQVSVLQSSLIPNSKFYAFSLQGTHLKIILLIKL